jgi:hypothetical protein
MRRTAARHFADDMVDGWRTARRHPAALTGPVCWSTVYESFGWLNAAAKTAGGR